MTSKLFTIMRFQILSASLIPGPGDRIGNAYVYAWDEGVYPLQDDGAVWHIPFADDFSVPEKRVEELLNYLADCWDKKNVPTFYELEKYYDVRSRPEFWSRHKLIITCRYFKLKGLFDGDFWKALQSPTQHPTEARGIDAKYDRDNDVYLN